MTRFIASLWVPAAVVVLALVFLAGLFSPASALTAREAAKVVALVEQLQPEFGPLAYDRETADDWFDRDAAQGGAIVRAGFTRDSWRAALDATICGYLASIPQETVDALFDQMRQRLARTPRMNAEQRAAALAFVEGERERFEALRAAGQADIAVVRPFTPSLRQLLPQEIAAQ